MNFDTITYSNYNILQVSGEKYYQIFKEIDSYKYKELDLFPITKAEFRKSNHTDTINEDAIKNPFADNLIDERIFSQELSYNINGKNYIVWKHIDYNCYDPLCGSRHSHVAGITGVTYFSPDYGILFKGSNGNVTLEILVSIGETNIPKDLIIQILKEQNIKNEIIHKYKML